MSRTVRISDVSYDRLKAMARAERRTIMVVIDALLPPVHASRDTRLVEMCRCGHLEAQHEDRTECRLCYCEEFAAPAATTAVTTRT